MWASWLKKLVEMSLQRTVHALSNATQQGSTTTVCAIKFNVLSTYLWRELAQCSVSHPNALPLTFLCRVYVCVREVGGSVRLSSACYWFCWDVSFPSKGKSSSQSFSKSQKIVDVMVPLRWPAFSHIESPTMLSSKQPPLLSCEPNTSLQI